MEEINMRDKVPTIEQRVDQKQKCESDIETVENKGSRERRGWGERKQDLQVSQYKQVLASLLYFTSWTYSASHFSSAYI